MKKLFLFVAIFSMLVLTACGGDSYSSSTDSYNSKFSQGDKGHWGNDGYYHPSESERQETINEIKEYLPKY